MKSFFEGLKDFVYESMDYLLIIAIIIGVVSLIGWRLDILFDDNKVATSTPPIVADHTDIDDIDNRNDDNGDDLEDADTNLPPDDSDDEDEEPSGEEPDPVDKPDAEAPLDNQETVTITIPDGTLPSGIGAILETNGLIDSKNEFVLRAQSMSLDRRLRSGTYKIQKNASLDEIIRIIAKQN